MKSISEKVNVVKKPFGKYGIQLYRYFPVVEAGSTGLKDLEEAALAREIAGIKLMQLLRKNTKRRY